MIQPPLVPWVPLSAFVAAVALFSSPLAADSVVVFNELHYNPSGSAEDGEWIELHNQMAVNIDLSGWRLDDGVEFTFPAGTIVPGGGYLVVAKEPGNPALAGAGMVLGPYSGSLSNGGELVDLLSSADRVMDRLEYDDGGEWPVAADGSGVTLAKRDPSLASGKSANWTASSQTGGTPGTLNFPAPGDLIRHTLVAPDATWRFDDSGSAPAGTWRSVGFADGGWSEGEALFGTDTGGGTPVLTVTQHLVQRFRAADIAGATQGQALTTWTDTATGDGATQSATAGGDPRFEANATPSGDPAVRFDGNDEFRASQAPGIGGTSGFAYVAVVRANSPPSGGGVTDGSGPYLWDREHASDGNPLVSLKNDGGRFGFQKRHDDGSGLGGPVSSSAISTSEFQIVATRRNRSQNRFEVWVNGVMESSAGDSGAALTPQPIVIARHATNTSGGFDGDIAELLVYDDELTESEFEAVGAYLESRYGLDTAYPGSAVTTPISPAAGTAYFRQSFAFNGDPGRTTLRLDSTVADGAVFYLNGSELHRVNLSGGAATHSTKALSDVPEPASSGFLPVSNSALVNGPNVLAVSLHTAAGNNTAAFAASLEGTETPPDPSSDAALVLNEVSGAGDVVFYVEIANAGSVPVSTNGYVLAIEGSTPASIPLPVTVLPPGGLLQLSEAQLGQRPFSGDKLFLRTPGGAGVADAREVTNRLRGRSTEFPGQWIFPSAPTPGAANSFTFQTDVVINELCYNAPILPAAPGIPPVVNTVPLIAPDAVWRHNAAGENLGANWAQMPHPVGGNWQSGGAIIGFDTGFPHPIVTPVASPQSNVPYIVTYYFETDFPLTAQQAASLDTLDLTHIVDDGAVFYLNGVEIHRFNIPAGAVTASTFAGPSGVDQATFVTSNVAVPPATAVAGTNRLSVEVHQVSLSSGDVIFGLGVEAPFVIDPGTPDQPRRDSDEQWLELYNRGAAPVDLSGWDFGEGIEFTFPANTMLGSGEYLVLAKDPAAVLAAHPGINVLGPYSGSLSRNGETLILRDAANNPADIVRYGDGGQWPGAADGGGSTLELRDPDADNSRPAAWAASDELARTSWQTYTYRGIAAPSSVGPDNQWREFVFGLHEEGEILIDDIRVTESPDGAAVPFLSNGTFESGTFAGWRPLGNHRHVEVVPDPDGGGNVLHLRATGSTEHMHNHLETTLATGRSVTNGREYEISFRARWLSGNNLLHTRLYFNRLPMTTELERPSVIGTPGAVNSTAEANIGPASWGLTHFPPVPAQGEPVTVSVNVTDPDGIGPLTLHYAVNGGGFQQVPMAAVSGTAFEGVIAGQGAGQVVQFFVEAEDAPGAVSLIPAGGAESRAMFEVEDGRAANTGIHNLRIVMTPADVTWMHTDINVMSNDRLPCTVIYKESEIYYDCGVRIKGSERARSQAARVGFNLGFPKDRLFRGVHRTIAIDRSEGQHVGQGELLFDLMATSSRGVPGEFNDLCYVISPNPTHTSAAILQLARFSSVFLESQFDNGDKGTVYEYELIYYPTTANASGYKFPQPDGVVGTSITSLGDNPESYRWNYLIKNNQEYDDFSGVISMVKQFDRSGGAFNLTVNDVLDVDQWLRSLAYSCATGAGDSYFANSRHNGQFYARPDGRMLYFTHDVDFAFNASRGIFENNELQELTVDPSRRRAYLGHLHDICTTVFNQSWMAPWHSHYNSLVPGTFTSDVSLGYINARSTSILSQINNQVAPVAFSITTNGGSAFSTSSTPVTLVGDGWVNVREIRLAGSATPLPAAWSALNRWSVSVPVSPGPNMINLEAVDFTGEVVGTDSIMVTSTAATGQPSTGTLVVSEIYYNPPGSDESTEYLELLNISPTATLDLTGVSLTGVTFTFPAGSDLAPGERLLLVSNEPAFESAFGSGKPVAGTYAGNLDNGGEPIGITLADGTPVQGFAYDDDPPWPAAADGDGYSLVLVDPASAPDHNLAVNWRASAVVGGSPGGTDTIDYATWKAGFGNPGDFADPDGDQLTVTDEWFFGGSPNVAEVLGPVYNFLPDGMTMEATVPRRAEADNATIELQTASDLLSWSPAAGAILISNERLPGSAPAVDLLTFRVILSPAPQFFRFAFGP